MIEKVITMMQTTQQKVAVSMMGALACAVIFLGFSQLQTHLVGPKKQLSKVIPINEASQIFSSSKDTDNDGLTDIEEETSYGSSPYLTDSDSDGVSDNDEVRAGTDPACPQGKNCFKGDFGYALNVEPTTLTDTIQIGARQIQPGSTKETTEGELNLVLGGGADPKTIREMLIKAGGKPEVINKLTDEQLKKIYEDTLKESPDLQAQQQLFNDLKNVDLKQVREEMVKTGVPKAQVDALTDEQIYAALLESAQTKPTN